MFRRYANLITFVAAALTVNTIVRGAGEPIVRLTLQAADGDGENTGSTAPLGS